MSAFSLFLRSRPTLSALSVVLQQRVANNFQSAVVRSCTFSQRPRDFTFPSRISCNTLAVGKPAMSMSTTSTNPMSAAGSKLTVTHDVTSQEFVIMLENDKALLQYEQLEDGAVDLWHTLVPSAFRGKGVAKLLAQAALDHFVQKSTPIHLSCTYLQKYVKDFPQPAHQQFIVKN